MGHLPFLARLATRLLTGGDDGVVVAFEPGTLLCLERGEDGRWQAAWMVRPALLRGEPRRGGR